MPAIGTRMFGVVQQRGTLIRLEQGNGHVHHASNLRIPGMHLSPLLLTAYNLIAHPAYENTHITTFGPSLRKGKSFVDLENNLLIQQG